MSIKFAGKITATVILIAFFSLASVAQQTPQPSSADDSAKTKQAPAQQPAPPAQPSPADKTKTDPQSTSGKGRVAGTSNDRLFYTLPNFLTLEKGVKVPPLSTKEKFKVVALGTFDPIQYPWWGLLSAIGQAENSEPAFGQGWAAYGKRYGATAADSTIENFIVVAVFPSVFHQDPRFYQSGEGGVGRRAGYAISRLFVTRGDNGKSQFNVSEIFGSALAAAISTYSYHPTSTYLRTPDNPHLFVGSDRTLTNAGNVWATQLTLDTITIGIKEFWPDIHRKLSKKKKDSLPEPPTPKP